MRWIIAGYCVAALVLFGGIVAAYAHNGYESWQRNDGKGSCCNNQDCRPVQWRDAKGEIEIQIPELGGAWRPAPRATILPFSSPDDRGHACYLMENGQPRFLCVALPTNM